MRQTKQRTNRLRYILYIVPILTLLFITHNTSALDYSSNTNIQFTFSPTISVSISGNLSIDNLSPGTAKDSNIVDVNVATNNVTGYNLSATVGNTSNSTTNLTNIDSSDYKFTSLSSDTTNLSDFSPNTWGYSYSTSSTNNTSTTTWHDYSSLPLYNDVDNPGTILSEKYNASNDVIKFKIGARAGSTQAAGTYSNTINFTAIGNPEVRYYMHEFTNALCSELASEDNYTIYDIRDGSDYTVRYINGQCWMTQNLRITGTISAEYSNFDGVNFNASQYSLDVNDASYADHCDNTNGYNYACSKYSGSVIIGTWYNYYAASAGTIGTNDNSTPTTKDICPAGWHLPSGPNTSGGTDFNKLIGNTISNSQPVTSGLAAFNAVSGGNYNNGSLEYSMFGLWWSALANAPEYRYHLFYNGVENKYRGSYGDRRYLGFFVRCVHSS